MAEATRLAAAAALVALLAGTGWAADAVPLTLTEALERAGSQNPDLMAARERTAAVGAEAEAAGRAPWPRLGLTTGWTRTDTPAVVFAQKLNAGDFAEPDFAIDRLNAPGALSHQTTVLSVEIPLDLAGKLGARTRGQRAGFRAAEAATREAAEDLRLRVVEAYRGAFLASRAVRVTERALAGARAREADIAARVEQGAALQADLLRARARRREREADLAERRGDAEVALAALSRLLGADPGARFVPVDEPEPPAPLSGNEETWIAKALANRAGLEAARQRLEAARWALRGEHKALLPDLGVVGQLQDDRSTLTGGARSGLVGVMLRWNAFDATRGKREAAAEARLRAAEQDLRAAQDQVRLEVEQAFRRASAARERYAAAAGGAQEGREALRVIQQRREAGMATLTDELETEAASLAAALRELTAAAQAAVADAALHRAAGDL